MNTQHRAYLALADGTIFEGFSFGASGVTTGEVVFTTGMTGYQEVLTDPSFCGQLVTMTAAHIGNTGIVDEDAESVNDLPQCAGFIVNDMTATPSCWRSNHSLHDYLAHHNIVGISDIDTRRLTKHLRDKGSQNGAIGTLSPDELVARARSAPDMSGLDLVQQVTPKQSYTFTESSGVWATSPVKPAERHVVAIDCGLKRNILRCLVDVGCRVTVVPATSTAQDILQLNPDGVFLSNGPGDPAALPYVVETVKGLLGKKPLFGICLGHQVLALALGAKTYKLKFGHRGINQPVLDLTTGKVEITTQNHGFAVDVESLKGKAETTHIHLNDRTSEGLAVDGAFSVQYHPEAAAGPHDSHYLFERFVKLIDNRRTAN